jgi:hypothetical protein
MKRIVLIISMLAFATAMQAQSLHVGQDILTWKVDRADFIAKDSSMTVSCGFVTQGSQIKWIQKDGGYTTTFTVNSSSGTWDDPNTEGWMLYQVTTSGRTGSIRIEKKGSDTTVKVTFLNNGADTLPYFFHVTSVSK